MEPKETTCGITAEKLKLPAVLSTDEIESGFNDSSITDEREKPVDAPPQIEKFFDLNESFIFEDVPENESTLQTLLVDEPSKSSDDNLENNNFFGTNPASGSSNLTIDSQIYRSSKGYSKFSKVSDKNNQNTNILHSDENGCKSNSKLPIVFGKVKNNVIFGTKNNKSIRKKYSKVQSVSEDEIDNPPVGPSSTKNSEDISKLSKPSDIISDNTETVPIDMIKNSRKKRKKYSKVTNDSLEIDNMNTVLSNGKTNKRGRKKKTGLAKVSKELMETANTPTSNAKKGQKKQAIKKHSPVLSHVISNTIKMKELDNYSGVNQILQKSPWKENKYENQPSTSKTKTRVYHVTIPIPPQSLNIDKDILHSKLTEIVKKVSKNSSPPAALAPLTVYKESNHKSYGRKSNVDVVTQNKESPDILSNSLSVDDSCKIVQTVTMPHVSVADFIGNRKVFESLLKDKAEMSYVDKLCSSPELNKWLKTGPYNSDKSNKVSDDSQNSDVNKTPLKRSARLKCKPGKNYKKFGEKSEFTEDKVIKLSNLVRSDEISITKHARNSSQHINNNKTCDNFDDLRLSENVNKFCGNKLKRKDISGWKHLSVKNNDYSEVDAFEDMDQHIQTNSSTKDLLHSTNIQNTPDISRLFNGTLSKYENSKKLSTPTGRKQLDIMDFFHSYEQKFKLNEELTICPVKQIHSENPFPNSSKNIKQITKPSVAIYQSSSPENNKRLDSMCLSSKEKSLGRGKSVSKAGRRRRSISKSRSLGNSVDKVALSSQKNLKKENKFITHDFYDSTLPKGENGSNITLAVPFDSLNKSLLSNSESCIKSSKKRRNTISNILSKMQTKTDSSLPNFEAQSEDISPIKYKTSKMEYSSLQNTEKLIPKKRKRSQSVHVVSDSMCDENDTIACKTERSVRSKGNQKFLNYDSSIESTVMSKRRKRATSMEPNLLHSRNSETILNERLNTSDKQKERYSKRHRRSQLVSNYTSADSDDSTTEKSAKSISQTKKRKRSASVGPKSYLGHSSPREDTQSTAESEKMYYVKNKRSKQPSSFQPKSRLNPFTDSDLEGESGERNKERKSRGRPPNKPPPIKIQQVCSQNPYAPNSNSLFPELSNTLSEAKDEKSNCANNSFNIYDDNEESKITTTNEQNGYQYLPTSQPTNVQFLNNLNNAYIIGSPYISAPQSINRRIVPYVTMPNQYGNVSSVDPNSPAQNVYSFPLYQVSPLVQPPNFHLNNSSNMNISQPSEATESNDVNNLQSTPKVGNIGMNKGNLRMLVIDRNNICRTTVTNVVNSKPSEIKNFNEEREGIVQDIKKSSVEDLRQSNQSYFSENKALAELTVREYYSRPLVRNTLQPKISKLGASEFETPSKLEFEFCDTFFESPIREVMKDYVDSHVKVLYKGPATKKHFVKLSFKKFNFRDICYFCDALPKEDCVLNFKDLCSYLCSTALVAIFDECNRRNLL